MMSENKRTFLPKWTFLPTQQFYVDSLTNKGDLHLNSPYSITPESHIKVMRIKEVITNFRNSWLLNKFSLSAP